MSLGEVLRVESVLFTARNKLIGADFSERASERERERERGRVTVMEEAERLLTDRVRRREMR